MMLRLSAKTGMASLVSETYAFTPFSALCGPTAMNFTGLSLNCAITALRCGIKPLQVGHSLSKKNSTSNFP